MIKKHPELVTQVDLDEISKEVRDLVLPRESDIALDIGAGRGKGVLELASSVKKVYGIEIRPERLAIARERAAKAGLDNVELRVGVAQTLPYPDESFDIVTCRFSFHHFDEPTRVLSEVNRVLKPGGKYLTSDPVFSEYGKQVWVPVNRLRELDFHSFYTYLDTVQMLNRSGFEIIAMRPFYYKRVLNKWVADGCEGVRDRIKDIVLGLDKRVLKELRFTMDPKEGWIWYYNCLQVLAIKRRKPLVNADGSIRMES